MDNDGIHKFAYRLAEFFADLLRLVAPALAAELDFGRAEQLPTSHVATAAGQFLQRHGDMAWRVPHRRGAMRRGSRPWLVVVVEFQSTVHPQMAQRIGEYCRMLRESPAVRVGADGRPALLPLVVYNGSECWTAPGAVVELPAPWSMAARLALAPFQDWAYVLLSLERLLAAGGGGLARLPLANRAAATLRLQAERTAAGLLARLRGEWVRFPGVAERATREVLHAWVGALLASMAGAESVLPTVGELEGLTGETEMATVSEARLGKWFEEVRAEHMAAGMEQGIQQERVRERARALARLRRQAAIKFGAQTAEQLAQLLGMAITTEQVERLADWIVECDRGAELLARVTAMRGNGRVEG